MEIPRLDVEYTARFCFACSQQNPKGLKLKPVQYGEKVTAAEFTAGKFHQGWGNAIHGGILYTLLDEVTAYAMLCHGIELGVRSTVAGGLRQAPDGGAFNELVRRHLDVVHSAALRMLSDPHLAEDVSQGAFMALAENAGKLAKHPVLAGWLHCTTRNLAANAIRTDARRRLREQEAASMNEVLSATPDPSWEQIAPHLDAALGELAEPDRDAVLLRYFQKKSAEEMGSVRSSFVRW